MESRIHRIRTVQRLARMAQAQPLAREPQGGAGQGVKKKPQDRVPAGAVTSPASMGICVRATSVTGSHPVHC